jgi:hypothetical protein
VNCKPARGCRHLCTVAPTYELLLPHFEGLHSPLGPRLTICL